MRTCAELRVFDPSLIDTSVDPCDNFYRFSCNGWFKRNPLPPDQTSYGRFTELYELNRLHLKQILEQAATPSPSRTAKRAKDRRRIRELHGSDGHQQSGHRASAAGARPHRGAEIDRELPARSVTCKPSA